MTAILQISDTHIVAKGEVVSGRLETSKPLTDLLQRILDARDQFGNIDAVLFSGDLSDDGTVQSYEHFREIVSLLGLPVYVISGNHDAREPLRNAFVSKGYLPASGKLNWVSRIGDVHLIGLDTLIEGSGAGTLDEETLSFLKSVLSDVGSGPVLLAMHHPPFKTHIHFMDKIGLENVAELTRLLADYQGEIRIVCGHIHSMMTVTVGGHVALSAPSPISEFAFDTRADAPVGFLESAGGCLLHRWDRGFQTIHINPTVGAGPYPF